MKIAIKLILLIGVVSYFIFAIVSTSQNETTRICTGTEILLEGSATNFVTKKFINDILAKTKIQIKGQDINDIDINLIEAHIKSCPYVDSALCYYTPNKVLCLKIELRKPILHVLANNGESYYMDINGNVMPTTDFALDLCVATGHITKKIAQENLVSIAQYLSLNKKWGNEIQQININNDKQIEFVPLTGDHKIIIGDESNLEDKMRRLEVFYREGLDKAGWNKYSTINLSYDNQVVCTKRTKK